MYSVTQAFKTAAAQPIQRHVLRGTVNGVSFTQSDVIAKSFKITNQLCENTKISLGGVYTAKLEITFETSFALSVVSRGSWQGVVIVPELGLTLADASVEYLPAPSYSYTVNEAKWTEKGLAVIAYDNLSKFDKSIDLNQSSGKVYDFLAYACQRCGVDLGMDPETCAALTNGGYTLGLYPSDAVQTYRDMIAWLAQACAAFAYIGRDGKLYFKSLPEPVEVDTINTAGRFTGAAFSDFITFYTGLSVVNIEDNTTSYYNVTPDNGLVMNLGANPFLQYGTDEIKNAIRQNILDKLATFAATPFSAAMLTNPAYDLGDCIKFVGGIADDYYGVVMQYVLDIDKLSVLGFGENPALMSAQSKTDKDISGLRGQNKENRITYYTYSNVSPREIGDGDAAQVCNIRFSTIEQTTVTLWQEYNLGITLDDPDTPATVTAYYYVDGVLENYEPVQTYGESGAHVLGLQYYLQNVDGGTAHTFAVDFEVDGGTVVIPTGDIHVCLQGQGLVGADAFNGFIEASDEMPLFVVAGIACGSFEDAGDLETVSNENETANDNYPLYDLGFVKDYINDQNGEIITDQNGDYIEAAGATLAPLFTDGALLVLKIDTDFAAYLTADASNGLYVGENMDAGLFNILYTEGE